MLIRPVTQKALLSAMKRFDRELRHRRAWANWHHKKNHKYAIAHGRELYPVKRIIALATGMSVMDFYGGEGVGRANEYVRARHLDVEELRTGRLKQRRGISRRK